MPWHCRFVHLGFVNLGVLQGHGMVHGVEVLQGVIANMVALGRVSGPSLLWVGRAVAHVHQQQSQHVDKFW
jgi:hypothetical protein